MYYYYIYIYIGTRPIVEDKIWKAMCHDVDKKSNRKAAIYLS